MIVLHVPLRPASLTHKNSQGSEIIHGMHPVGCKDRSIDLNMCICRNIPFMLMSEPTAKKLCKEDMYVCPLNRDIYIYIYIHVISVAVIMAVV